MSSPVYSLLRVIHFLGKGIERSRGKERGKMRRWQLHGSLLLAIHLSILVGTEALQQTSKNRRHINLFSFSSAQVLLCAFLYCKWMRPVYPCFGNKRKY